MTVREIIKELSKLPQDATVHISKCFILDEHEQIIGILDYTISGITQNKQEPSEIRFVLDSNGIKNCFHPDEFIPIDTPDFDIDIDIDIDNDSISDIIDTKFEEEKTHQEGEDYL